MAKCMKCGKEVENNEIFCSGCGTKLYHCEKCGAIYTPGDTFCGECGNKLPPKGEPIVEQTTGVVKKDEEKNGNLNKIIASLAALVLLAGGYYGYRKMVVIPREKAEIIAKAAAENDKAKSANQTEKTKSNNDEKPETKKNEIAEDSSINKKPKSDGITKGVIIDTDSNGLNVRSGPGTNYPIVESLHYGSVVDIKDSNGSWYHINHRGTIGWASGNLISVMENVRRDGYINAPDSNIRSGPSSKSTLLGVFAKGEKVYVIGHANGWYNLNRSNGMNCWVYDGYVSF